MPSVWCATESLICRHPAQASDVHTLNHYRLKPVGLVAYRELRTEVLRSLCGNPEALAAVARLVAFLFADVRHDCFLCHITT